MSVESEGVDQGEGENYFVSMTDMMVGVLFIFIIMLMSFALMFQQRTDEQETKISVAEDIGTTLSTTQAKIEDSLNQLAAASELRRQMLQQIRAELVKLNIKVEINETGDVLRFNDDAIRFEPDKSALSSEASRRVGQIAAVLAQVLPRFSVCGKPRASDCRSGSQSSLETVFIEGHTDGTGDKQRNWTLSAERAANTYAALVAATPALLDLRNRADTEILSISGYADTRPVDPAKTSAAWRLNRRIDLRFVMDNDATAGLQEVSGLLGEMREQIGRLKAAAP